VRPVLPFLSVDRAKGANVMNIQKMVARVAALLVVLGFGGGALGNEFANRDDTILVPVNIQLPQYLGTYSDVDKLNLATLKNWYNDLNNNNLHDPGEPFAAAAKGGWGNPKVASDNSCWLASGVNMLKQLGKVTDANALYMNYALNGVTSPAGTLTWDDGGLQEYVVQQWATQNPTHAADLQTNIHWRSAIVSYGDGHYAWEDINARSAVANYLAAGWEVGIGMWPLDSSGHYSSGHALTMQAVPPQSSPPKGTFDVTDSDRDNDWSGPGDLNTYADWTYGPTAYLGHNYYAWFNDFYSGNWAFWPDGDVGYVVAITPEPTTLGLLALGGLALLARRRRK